MIPRPGPRAQALPSLKLHREDFERLISLLKTHCQHVTFGDEEHLYNSLEEMETFGSRRLLKFFMVSGLIPHIEIALRGAYKSILSPQRSVLFVMERNEKSDLLFFQLKSLFEDRTWWSANVRRLGALIMAGVLFVVCLFTKRIHGVSYDICAIVMLCLFVSGSIMTTTQRSFLTLRSRSDSPSFWEKYRDDFFKQAITSVIAGIIGYLAGHFLK